MLDCANFGRPTLLLMLLLLLLLLIVPLTPVLVWMCHKWYVVPPQYPQNVDGQLRNDQALCTELQGGLKTALFGMCTNNPTVRGKPRHADAQADLNFKRAFCIYL